MRDNFIKRLGAQFDLSLLAVRGRALDEELLRAEHGADRARTLADRLWFLALLDHRS